jgi:hypothetical protein
LEECYRPMSREKHSDGEQSRFDKEAVRRGPVLYRVQEW